MTDSSIDPLVTVARFAVTYLAVLAGVSTVLYLFP